MITRPSRRDLLRLGAAGALALPWLLRRDRRARADALTGGARRLIVFYFPDGVVGASQNGEPSEWHPTGGETGFTLPWMLEPLAPFRDQCVFFRGLSMGSTDAGSHPGGAKKLLTATDGGYGRSIDQHLAATVGADRPFRHLYLGAMANHNGASGDKHISYVGPGQTVPPEDDPRAAFQRLFGAGTPPPPGPGPGTDGDDPRVARRRSVLDTSRQELLALRGRLDTRDQQRLDLHAEAIRELEARLGGGGGGGGASCGEPYLDTTGIDGSTLYDPGHFPDVLRAQIDLAVQATACELTRVAVIQASSHTSELIMSRFADTPMYDPGFDMRSHQASHYGPAHDEARREFLAYRLQRRWWVEQFAYLLDQLRQWPEGDGTMLDHSLVLLCTEVCDGNTHLHDDMPLVLAGGGGGAIRPGRLLSFSYRRHADLLLAIAHAMGDPLGSFGDASGGPLPGLLA